MSEPVPTLTTLRASGAQTAIVFVHGFGGNPSATWGEFPQLIQSDARVADWDLYTVGYATRLTPDIVGIWKANAPLDRLAILLKTVIEQAPLDRYKSLTLVAHSMGGLIAQRALVDFFPLASRVSHVFFFGTPSGGLAKAGPFAFLKRQARDMGESSDFVRDLRERWKAQFAVHAPFHVWTVAGDQDEFVPSHSSLDPFPLEQRAVVAGDHLSIVKPKSADDLGFKVLLKGICGDAAPAGAANPARVAVESREFVKAVKLFESHPADLDTKALVSFALALEETGRQEEAIQVLEQNAGARTDPMGVLAGRLKRRWLVEGRRSDAERALELYRKAYALSADHNDDAQAFYHGINIAFMELAGAPESGAGREPAREMARTVLRHCAKAERDFWRLATEGDAHLILGETETAAARYREAVGMRPEPRWLKSMCQQALRVADLLRDEHAERYIEGIWRGTETGGLERSAAAG